jgi:hypothetical protein
MPNGDIVSTAPPSTLTRSFARFYFVGLALFTVAIAAIVFVPGLLKFFAGTFAVAWVLNVHGVLMGAWLALFLAQAVFAATGRMRLHEMFGNFGIWLGPLVWASMVFVELRRKVVYPLAPDLSSDYDFDLPGIYVWSMFLLYFVVAIRLRRQRPDWHKRFMVFAALVALQAAEMRIAWLPRFAPDYWTDVIYLDVFLLLPLLAYDFVTGRRLHPATATATAVLLTAQATVILLWGSSEWRHLAYVFTVGFRSYL